MSSAAFSSSNERQRNPEDNNRSRSRSPATSKVLANVKDSGHDRNNSAATGNSVTTNKSGFERKVRVKPPYARDEPPSPTLSPRLSPSSSPTSTAGFTQLQPVCTYDSETTSVGPNDPVPWWTFVSWPGRHKSPVRRESQTQNGFLPLSTLGGTKWKDPAINLDAAERGDYFEQVNGSGEGGPGPSTFASRLKMSIPISRRASMASTDDHPRRGTQMEDRRKSFALEPPFMHRINTRRSMHDVSTTEMEQLPSAVSEPVMSKPPTTSWHQVVTAAQKQKVPIEQKGSTEAGVQDPSTPPSRLRSRLGDVDLQLKLPPSAMVHDAHGAVQPGRESWRLEGIAPPTPDGWDTSWENGPQVYRRGRRKPQTGTAWEEEFEEQDEIDRDADTNESTAVERRSGSEEGKKVDVRKGSRKARFTAIVELRKQRMKTLFLQNVMVALGVRIFNLGCVLAVLGLAASQVHYERLVHLPGIIGPSPVLTLAYAVLTTIHILFAIWMEWNARPIGLWDLKRQMAWICLDLLFIALWSSDLSVAVSDLLATPLDCSSLEPWWNPPVSAEIDTNPLLASKHDTMCDRQSAIIAFVAFILFSYVANMVLSLFKTLEKVALAARAPTRHKDRGL